MTFRTGFAQMFALALLMATACGAPGSHTDPGGSADPDTGDGVSNPRGDGGPGPSASDPGYVEMGVYFATDRDWHVSRGVFTGERGSGSLAFGHTKVSIPNTHEVGSLEAPPWWRLWDRDSPSEFVVLLSIDRFDGLVEFSDSIGKALASATSDEILVFVHGFNTSFADAARRTAQLAYDLRFPGVSVFFSWPSRGEAGEYAADETSVEWSQPHFDRFLQISLSQLGARRVHVIAHSMGSRVLSRGLAALDPSALPPEAAELRQVVLAAPDIDLGIFRQLAAEFAGKADRITLYASASDRALQLSYGVHDYPRAGGQAVPLAGIETIDASGVETSFLAHSYFGDSILGDLYSTIVLELPTSDRFGLAPVSSPEGPYWRLLPGAFR